jgi:2-dehydro-3-deoxygluconokinase
MMKSEVLDIVSLGEAMVEFNQTSAVHDAEAGRMYLQGFGGDTSNFAIAAARQGASVAYLSSLGDDPYAKMLRDLWDKEGVNHEGVTTQADAFTAIYFVNHDGQGHHFSFFRKGSAASLMNPATLPLEIIKKAKALHLSGITLAISPSACDTAYAAMAVAREAGVLVTFDTNLRLKLWSMDRARAVMNDVIGRCDICLPSFEDVVAITGKTDPDDLVDHCLQLGAKVVALKLGDKGALVADTRQRHLIAPHPCRAVDATGAGDTFGGAFVYRLLEGDTLEQAGCYAAVAAALSTEGYGAVAPIPQAAQVLQARKSCAS